MTLTDFLLARIAEDEGRTTLRHVVGCALHKSEGRSACDCGLPKRTNAECEAKRRIVEVHHPLDDDPEPFCWNCDEETWPCRTVAALAAVYADHPDYDESWRP